MGVLKNYREVGKFDVLEAPRNPIGAFDAEQFKKDALAMLESGTTNLVVDLGNLDYLYSDAFNAFAMIHQKLAARAGTLGILATDELAVKSLQQAGVDRYVEVYRNESQLMAASLRATTGTVPAEHPSAPPSQSQQSAAPAQTSSAAEEVGGRRFHRFTQSFNSFKDDDEVKGGLKDPFDVKSLDSGSSRSGVWVISILLVLAIAGGLLAWYWFG